MPETNDNYEPETEVEITVPVIEQTKGFCGSLSSRLITHKRRVAIAALICITVIVLFSSAAVIIPLAVTCSGSNSNGQDYDSVNGLSNSLYIRNSAEYQIVYSDISSFADRPKEIKSWLATITEASKFLDLNYEEGTNEVRHEYALDTKACKTDTFIRVREYIQGPQTNTTTIDVKKSDSNRKEACDVPFWPSLQMSSFSLQKCERDVHECHDKYSRETRITVDDLRYAKEAGIPCSDLSSFYPYNFTPEKTDMKSIAKKTNDGSYWFLYSYIGSYPDGSGFELAFTLRYDKLETAISGSTAPRSGEFSIRITSKNSGYSAVWNDEVISDADHIWKTLIATYGNNDDC